MRRLFIAIDIPEEVKDAVSEICYGLPEIKWTRSDQFHLTIKFLGEVDEEAFLNIRDALETVKLTPFPMSMRGAGHFDHGKGSGVLWLGVTESEQLTDLFRDVERVLLDTGIPREKRKFRPHITLGRLKKIHHGRMEDWMNLHSEFESEEFVVSEFYLYESKLKPEGPVHTILNAYPLPID